MGLYLGCKIYVRGGDDIESVKDLEREYLKRYGEIIDDVNKQLDGWNEDWKIYCSGNMEEGSIEWDQYGQYIASLESQLCIQYNLLDRYRNSRITMDAYNNNGEPKLIGIIDNDPKRYFEVVFDENPIRVE